MGCSIPGLSLPNTPATEVKGCRLPSYVIFVRKLLLGIGRPLRCLCIGRLPPGAVPGLQATRRAWSQVLISDRGCKDRRKAPETTSHCWLPHRESRGCLCFLQMKEQGFLVRFQNTDSRTSPGSPGLLEKCSFLPTEDSSLHCVY